MKFNSGGDSYQWVFRIVGITDTGYSGQLSMKTYFHHSGSATFIFTEKMLLTIVETFPHI